MNLAHTLTGDYVVCYRIESIPGQVKLKLWEPTPHSGQRPSMDGPFLYAANFTFACVEEAESFLREYLLVNGAFDVPESDFPQEGQVEILPFPTWGMEP